MNNVINQLNGGMGAGSGDGLVSKSDFDELLRKI